MQLFLKGAQGPADIPWAETGGGRPPGGTIEDGRLAGRTAPNDRLAGIVGVVQEAAELRQRAGAPAPEPGSAPAARLTELTLALLGFLAGDPAPGLRSALERWRPDAPTIEEVRADLAAVGATLAARLAGPAPRLHRLVDDLTDAEVLRLTTAACPADRSPGGGAGRDRTGGSDVADPLAAFGAVRPQRRGAGRPPRSAPSIRRFRGGRGGTAPGRGGGRRPGRRRGLPRSRSGTAPRWWPVGTALTGMLLTAAALVSGLPGQPEALLPNHQRVPAGSPAHLPAPAPAPPVATGPAAQAPAHRGTGTGGAQVVTVADVVHTATAPAAGTPAAGPAGGAPRGATAGQYPPLKAKRKPGPSGGGNGHKKSGHKKSGQKKSGKDEPGSGDGSGGPAGGAPGGGPGPAAARSGHALPRH